MENQATVNPEHLRYQLMLRNLSELIAATRRDLHHLWASHSQSIINRADLIVETQDQLDYLLNYRDEVENAYAEIE